MFLVTGGLGFIGSHVCVQMIQKNYKIVILDNLSNSTINVIAKMKKITKRDFEFIKGDIRDPKILEYIFEKYHIEGVLHFAALKSVKESNIKKDLYDDVNVNGTINILSCMEKYKCHNFIYSSSSTVYGKNTYPVTELSDTGYGLTCVYARNKYDVEKILFEKYSNWNVVILRYFNPIGAHPSGLLGEDPVDTPNNVFPYLLRVVSGQYDKFTVYGNDYDTEDGTCLRDYIHVDDLATAHVLSLKKWNQNDSGLHVYNVGIGKPVSVLELINSLNKFLEKPINYEFGDRRDGDLPIVYSSSDKIKKELGWQAIYTIDDMCEHGIKFISQINLC